MKKLSEIFEIMIKVNEMKEKIDILKYQKQIILQGPPGTGKTRLAKQMANFIINGDTSPEISKNKDQVKLIQFHPSYSYEDFVRGIVAKANGTQIEYKAENKILAEMADKAKKALEEKGYYETTNKDEKNKILKEVPKYILIIDEINRANLSSVLGELIYALEYRDEAVESMYEVDGSKKIILPSNLYIIGTMNTADRSIGHIDYAIRRRFAFESILPDEDSIKLEKGKELFNKVKKLFKTDDNKIASTLSPEFNPDDVMLGHSYFIADNDDDLDNKLKYQVIPLLKEYVKDGVLNESALKEIESL
jgi:5-methylcytosine-specific restriction protein B